MAKHSLKEYREALILTEHLEAILKVTKLTLEGLKHFKHYIPVEKIRSVIKEQNSILEAHHVKYKKVKETKGQTS